jgi:hypothetical protein
LGIHLRQNGRGLKNVQILTRYQPADTWHLYGVEPVRIRTLESAALRDASLEICMQSVKDDVAAESK